jgi:hypothetical protein
VEGSGNAAAPHALMARQGSRRHGPGKKDGRSRTGSEERKEGDQPELTLNIFESCFFLALKLSCSVPCAVAMRRFSTRSKARTLPWSQSLDPIPFETCPDSLFQCSWVLTLDSTTSFTATTSPHALDLPLIPLADNTDVRISISGCVDFFHRLSGLHCRRFFRFLVYSVRSTLTLTYLTY